MLKVSADWLPFPPRRSPCSMSHAILSGPCRHDDCSAFAFLLLLFTSLFRFYRGFFSGGSVWDVLTQKKCKRFVETHLKTRSLRLLFAAVMLISASAEKKASFIVPTEIKATLRKQLLLTAS